MTILTLSTPGDPTVGIDPDHIRIEWNAVLDAETRAALVEDLMQFWRAWLEGHISVSVEEPTEETQ